MARTLSEDLFSRLEQGDRRAAARLITLIERSPEAAASIVKRIHHQTGRAHVIGITGSPGAGKSTLVDAMVDRLREDGKTVGVIAVDPSSPFTGGALLGDRIRMQKRSTDPDVFIRSMGARGHLGGVAAASSDAVKVLDALGKDVILIETVGVGQGEVEIMQMADTTVVVLVPGMGDDIQSIKAGLMEIGDVFVVNKADRDGVQRTVAEVEMNLMMGLGSEDRRKSSSAEEEAHHAQTGAKQKREEVLEEDRVHLSERRRAPRRTATKGSGSALAQKEQDAEAALKEDPSRVEFFEEMLEAGVWYPPVVQTIADRGTGVATFLRYLMRHHEFLIKTHGRDEKLRKRAEREVLSHVKERVLATIEEKSHVGERFDALVQEVAMRKTDPHTAADEMLKRIRHELVEEE